MGSRAVDAAALTGAGALSSVVKSAISSQDSMSQRMPELLMIFTVSSHGSAIYMQCFTMPEFVAFVTGLEVWLRSSQGLVKACCIVLL